MDSQNFVGPSGDGYDVYVNGAFYGHYTDLNAAQQAFNSARAASPTTAAPTAATPTVPNVSTTSPGANTTGGAYGFQALSATYAERRADAEVSKQLAERRLTLDEAQAAWQRSYQAAQLDVQRGMATGTLDGKPTLEALRQATDEKYKMAQLGGYTQTLGAGTGAKITAAAGGLRDDPAYQDLQRRTAAGDAGAAAQKRRMEIGVIANATGLPMERAQALSAELEQRRIATGGQVMGPEQIDALLAQNPAYSTPTLERERYQTDAALRYQEMLNNRRGPDDAFAYASMIRDTPESIRATINAAAAQTGLPGLRYPQYAGPTAAGGVAAPVAAPVGAVGGYGENAAGRMTYQRTAESLGQPVMAFDQRPTQPVMATDPRPGQPGVPQYRPQLVDPSQLSPSDWNRTPDYLKKMTWAGYEAAGYDKADAQDRLRRAMPRYQGPRRGMSRAA